nr:unknown [Zea mays]
MHVWAPKHHVGKKGTTISPLEPTAAKKKKKNRKSPESRPNVVLIHGFAAEGNVTWQFNFGVLVSRYNLYIPDLMFFGKSSTSSADRSPDFQAECVAGALARLGVARCDVVGFSYGGMVAFKLAEARPGLVRSLCVSGSVVAMTDAVNRETMERLGAGSSAELLMPDTLKGLKALLSVSMYRKMWFPDRFYKDYLKVMFTNRKERMELLQGLITSNTDAKIPVFQQKIMLLWGEEDKIFDIELARKMKEQLGDNCFLYGIRKAGHLLHVERPCAYNRQLQRWFAYVNSTEDHVQAR